jgi:hypothetical protein
MAPPMKKPSSTGHFFMNQNLAIFDLMNQTYVGMNQRKMFLSKCLRRTHSP